MKKNVVVTGTDREVIIQIIFTENGITLDDFGNIEISIGDETYTTLNNPDNIRLEDNQTIVLTIGLVTNLRPDYYQPTIIVYNSSYPNGYPLTNSCIPLDESVKVCG